MFQMALIIIFYVWLFLILYLLWRHALGGSAHVRRLQMLLNEDARTSAQAAMMAAEATKKLAEFIEKKYEHL